jgi:hypothetical protein
MGANPIIIPNTELEKYFETDLPDDRFYDMLQIHLAILMKKGMSRVDALQYLAKILEILSLQRKGADIS